MKSFVLKNKVAAVVMALLLVFVGGGAYFLGKGNSHRHDSISSGNSHETYSCPMHPTIVSDSPGKCPICQMELQKVENDGGAQPSSSGGKKDPKILFYRHPMKPEITSKVPSKDEMGMDFIPVFENEEDEATGNVSGRSGFSLSKGRQQLIGVTTGKVERTDLGVDIRASGKAAFDPDLFTAIEEYRQAVHSASEMKNSPYEGLRTQATDLIESARTKLRLLGLTDSQIRKLASGSVSPMSLLLPKGHVWIYAEVFEYELPQVKEGQTVEVVAPALPMKAFSGKITSISPIVNPQTRTARIRALVPDPERLLRPDTFVNVRIRAALGEKLVVPADAILHSGEDDFVFVVRGEGRFEPRKVVLGAKAKDIYEVASGLEVGETVVTSANFLIDSESRLRGVLKNMESGEPVSPSSSPTPSPRTGHR